MKKSNFLGQSSSKMISSSFRAQDYERPGVTSAEIQDIKQTFDLFDSNKTGYAHVPELLASLDAMGPQHKNQPIYHMISHIKEQKSKIDFSEFLDLMTQRVTHKDNIEDLRQVFRLFDDEKTGYISIKSLRRIVKELGENIDDQELQQMIVKADLDGDGLVSQDEFYCIMTKKSAQKKQPF